LGAVPERQRTGHDCEHECAERGDTRPWTAGGERRRVSVRCGRALGIRGGTVGEELLRVVDLVQLA
jgi:hypothetical protein